MSIMKNLNEKVKGFKMSKQLKRNLLLSASLLVICAAVFLNWQLNSGSNDIDGIIEAGGNGDKVLGESMEVSGENENNKDYFAVSVIDRERVRDEAIETLREIAYGESSDEESKKTALDKMTFLADSMTKEVNIENLVIAKGFEDCVAVVNESGVDVIVKSNGLLPSEVAQIRDIIIEQTGAKLDNIRIIEHN